jgi:branched-chain amino acid transport system ATP-binding protein
MLLKLERVSKSFGGLMAVRAMDLTVSEGEIVGLIGPNGAGKTTLFDLITGFYRSDEGCILFRDRDITGLGPPERCKQGIARTFQHVRPFQHLTLLENVAIGRIYGREPAGGRRQAEAEARELLALVGLGDQPEAHARTLTLMNRKRLELARALATRPYLLLLDELLAGLNPSEVLAAMELIRQIRAGGMTILLVEHLVKALFGVSDRVIAMDAGEKIAEGSPLEVASDPRVVTAYLGPARHVYA